jgi:hypothetical protein
MPLDEEKNERAFRMLATELFYQRLQLFVFEGVLKLLLPPDKQGISKSTYASYLKLHGDQAISDFFNRLRNLANGAESDDANASSKDALWTEIENMEMERDQEVADREWRRLWGAL